MSNHPLPSPANTPYHSLSRRTSRYDTPTAETPAPFPPDPVDASEHTAHDENISVLDPRRFTPTLHASLVSEILNLRRELDTKHTLVEDLETNLYTVRNENESLTSDLSACTKEGRALKRQLQQLENGTISALEEVVGERDKVRETNTDLRQKLEAAQKKIRGQEEDSTRVHDMWAREKEVWAGEKRTLERQVHISESRLKTVLEEFAFQAAAHEEAHANSGPEGMGRDSTMSPDSDAGSIQSSPQRRSSTRFTRHSRNISNSSFRSNGRGFRMSLISLAGSEGHGRPNGLSLADELTFDEEEEELEELELDSDDFPEHEMRARRALESRQSMCQDEKAKRVLGLSQENQTANKENLPAVDQEAPKMHHALTRLSWTGAPPEPPLSFPPPRPEYVDTGVQPSPPPSPVRPQSAASFETTQQSKPNDTTASGVEVEANQSRKRVSAIATALTQRLHITSVTRTTSSSSSQTVEPPLSPPATPTIAVPETPLSAIFKPEVASISTQTEPLAETPPTIADISTSPPKRAPPPVPISIPSIAIYAPTSAPPSPREPILPQRTKSISTQTSAADLPSNVRTTGMQTDPIRIDQRPIKLPPHLLPSAITSKPGTPEPGQERPASSVSTMDTNQYVSPTIENVQSKGRLDLTTLLERAVNRTIENHYPGNNDNGPLANDRDVSISRPFRSSSLFAGFDGLSSEEEDFTAALDEEAYNVPPYSTHMASARNLKNGRVFNNPPTPVPEEKESVPTSRPSEDSVGSSKDRSSFERLNRVGKPLMRNSVARQPSIRRSAMIQNGTAAHMRSRSPSLGSIASSNNPVRPPFPVPARSSSRKVTLSKSEGSQSPTPRGNGAHPSRRPYGPRVPQRRGSVRKVRSEAVIARSGRSRSRTPPLPETPGMPPSPELPPLPNELFTSHRYGHRSQPSTNTTITQDASVGSGGSQSNVVDAIAATMVGEWMWKYVRKRKAFGGPESPAGEEAAVMNSNGVRHKRWVWISPYERSVLWSSKQPTTSSALIGKAGRKRRSISNHSCTHRLTNFGHSHHSVCPRRCRQHTYSPKCGRSSTVQPIDFDPHSRSRVEVYRHLARTTFSLVNGTVISRSLELSHARSISHARSVSHAAGAPCRGGIAQALRSYVASIARA
jgi:hypothetical protein